MQKTICMGCQSEFESILSPKTGKKEKKYCGYCGAVKKGKPDENWMAAITLKPQRGFVAEE